MLNESGTTAYYQFSKLVVTSTPTDIYSPARIQLILNSGQISCLRHNLIFSCDEKSLRSNAFNFPLKLLYATATNFRSWICSMRSQLFDVKLDRWANVLWWEWLTRNKVYNLQANYVRIHFHFVWFDDKINFGLHVAQNLLNWELIYVEKNNVRFRSFLNLSDREPLSRIKQIKITVFSPVNFTVKYPIWYTCPGNQPNKWNEHEKCTHIMFISLVHHISLQFFSFLFHMKCLLRPTRHSGTLDAWTQTFFCFRYFTNLNVHTRIHRLRCIWNFRKKILFVMSFFFELCVCFDTE